MFNVFLFLFSSNFSEITQWDVMGGIQARDQKKKK